MRPADEPDEPTARFVRRSPLSRALRLCPRCLNPLTGGSKLGGWLIPMTYYCTKCGYTGTVFLEKDADASPPAKSGP